MSGFLPHAEEFCRLAAAHDLVPVWRRLASDTLTPVLAFHRIEQGGGACLFESVIGGEIVGRYSFLSANPVMRFTSRGNQCRVEVGDACEEFRSENPLEELRKRVQLSNVAHPEALPPFIGGAVGYASYDVVRYVESLPAAPLDDRGLPDLDFGFYDQMCIFDHVHKTVVVLALVRPADFEDQAAAYADGQSRVDRLVQQLTTPRPGLSINEIAAEKHGDSAQAAELPQSNFTQADFEQAVRKCVEYIRAGDIFQVVISQRFEVPVSCTPFEIYRTLRTVNPSPFMFFLRSPDVTLIGSSPEIMCRVVDDHITVRPLAGTRPRGATPEEDRLLAAELLADPKERAEHVMLVDLGRNDVGRVARYGTVELTDEMTIERYSHVMHITSNVNGQLQEDQDAFDALAACLPAGTVSGAPKVRAMQIIDEIEPHRRGPYAGAVGYFDFSGNMDTCIALRTLVLKGGVAYIQAGAGIVADSDPTKEYQETINKARGLIKSVLATEQRTQGESS
ncbi:MAG: anthranilate synthase component I [Planctomycetota bacterium]